MAQYSTALRTAWAGATEATVGTAPKLRFYSGTIPTDAGTALSGQTLLASGDLPSDWLGSASAGAVAKNGTWTVTCTTAGTATWWGLWDSAATTRHAQGPISEMNLSANPLAAGVVYTVNPFTITHGGA